LRSYLVAFVIAIVVCGAVTPLIRRLAPRLGAVDLPSGRRVNKRIVPRLGGIAILLGFIAPLLGLYFWDNDISREFLSEPLRSVGLFAGIAALTALGAYDDIRGIGAVPKLLVQLAVAMLAYFSGFQLDNVYLPVFGEIEMGVLGLPLTVLWIVGIINAVNLIDGLDGLACGVAFFVCVVNFTCGLIGYKVLVALMSASLGGALLGFLVYNWNPAKIFMGDSGSMSIGYALATISLLGAKGSTAVSLLVPVLAMGLPIMDTLLAVGRRLFSGRPLFSPDREHVHHRALDSGLSQRKAVLVLYGVTVALTGSAILVYLGNDWQVGMALLVSSVAVVGLVRGLGLVQLRALRRRQRHGIYDPATERVRSALPDALRSLQGAEGQAAALGALELFGRRAGLALLMVDAPGAVPGDIWTWESGALPDNGEDGAYVSATFPLEALPGSSRLKVGWRSRVGEVAPQTEILLRLLGDELSRSLARVAELRSLAGAAAASDERSELN
jgi:UDP-GlcNAc:undecaprenyl-phosphate/decaprenyl-phosphate GlcNAc-1-phosphate transferase